MKISNNSHLTYCMNVHPGESFLEVLENIKKYALPIKKTLGCTQFGLGLRLSNMACQELKKAQNMELLKNFCTENDLYIFTINGFVYSKFHETTVKESAYLPDWKSNERVEYTNVLASILANLISNDFVNYGSISTVPCCFKSDKITDYDLDLMVQNILKCISHIYNIWVSTGKDIKLALEIGRAHV